MAEILNTKQKQQQQQSKCIFLIGFTFLSFASLEQELELLSLYFPFSMFRAYAEIVIGDGE